MQATNKEQSIRIQSSGGLNEDQIQQMVRDAEAHAEADKERKGAIEARNEAETSIISAERSVAVSAPGLEPLSHGPGQCCWAPWALICLSDA